MSMKYLNIIFILCLAFIQPGCSSDGERADAYGNFEANEVIVSARGNGQIMQLDCEEGQELKTGEYIGYIDTAALHLQRNGLKTQRKVLLARSRALLSQIQVFEVQRENAEQTQHRIEALLNDGAATQQELDDITAKIKVLKEQIQNIHIQNEALLQELESLEDKKEALNERIDQQLIINPIDGRVLSKYSEKSEVTTYGRPIYKIADLSRMILRVYISETQLADVKIGQEVMVKIDDADGLKKYKGHIAWISDEAEFTPKIIQTKEERVHLVYAVKINVDNDGSLKIGMPGEMWLAESE